MLGSAGSAVQRTEQIFCPPLKVIHPRTARVTAGEMRHLPALRWPVCVLYIINILSRVSVGTHELARVYIPSRRPGYTVGIFTK